MTTDFTVRQARPTDAPLLAELRWAFKQEDHEEPLPSTARSLEQTESWIRDRLASRRWLAWVSETAGAICGHVFLQPVERIPEPYSHSAPLGYVTNFYVTPVHRNHGIGAALLRALAEHAQRAAFDTLIVWPSERSTVLYQRTGFHAPEELLELPLDI